MKDIRAGAVQFNHKAGDKEANWKIIQEFIMQAAKQDVKILVFPEMCITGYWHVRKLSKQQIIELSEPYPGGPSTQKLMKLAQEHQMTIGAGFIEQAKDGTLYNAYAIALPSGKVFRHRKLHCFISEHMNSGNEYTVFDTPHSCRVGVLTCWDNNLLENVRITALKGAEILLSPHQTGGCDSRSPRAMGLIDPALWQNRDENPEAIEAEFKGPKGRGWLMRWLPSRAHDNGLFLIFSNGVGQDDNEVRTGNAMILNPYGQILDETWKARNELVIADLEADLQPMSTGRRWLKGRRPELYKPICTPLGNEQDPRTVRFSKKSDK